MVNMENAEEVMQILERFTRLKQKEIPKELDEYLQYVAKTGDTVFKWSSLKYLFREKLLNVMKHFHDTTPHVIEIPQYPNVDPFNYESMKSSLLERLELFNAAPFTIQRLCELLIDPRKQYSRIDKFMRALEKNILVVSTIEPGRKRTESENGDSLDSVVNGDLSLDVNVDIDMENESLFNVEAQNGNGSSATVADIAAAAAAAAAAESESDACAIAASAEVKERALVTESPNVPHTADDDILPNPKKPKLTDADRTDVNKHHKDVTEKPVIQTTQISTIAAEVAQDNSNIPEEGELSKDDSLVTPGGKPTSKSADENKAVEEISIAGTVAAAAVEKSEEVIIAADSNTSSSAIAKSAATITTNLDNDGGEPIATAETPVSVSDAKALPADVKETSATSTTPSSPPEIAKATAAPVTIIPPTLALNDQPMEEQTEPALDDIAVIEAAATAPSTSSSIAAVAVEEIVMSEASCGAIDMATDAIEPTKDEPAGMEVDDTSQEEAMDQ